MTIELSVFFERQALGKNAIKNKVTDLHEIWQESKWRLALDG